MKRLLSVAACIGLMPLFAASPSFGEAAKDYTDATTGIRFARITGGCFKMGDTFGDGASNEKPPHDVCVSDFSMAKQETTQNQWKVVMGNNPSFFKSCGDDCPTENVSWNDVQEFISKLNKLSGKEYRLPTEAEWEYACRSGGKSEKFCGGNDVEAVAWYFSTSGDRTQRVARKRPNGLGIYDMSGNVWEWVSDWYDEKFSSIKDNPQGPSTGSNRVIRGGGWFMLPKNVRASVRSSLEPEVHTYDVGFRLVITAP
ncbi:formylglycine-generating enzyme family protein [Oryzomonas rubra]|uniref:Formylglycine-generating enzyme family protein n=1 Tax=Oryzomonas rubra TaxID=2509454 RepID=A0A5A9XPL8_9BACT|nr:formylglycine-generating enzyme family protein [Oryzomonas rubra]KAA0894944.1 formylglycine-generating enzyme family protein [Oryzomonas rubra]